MRKRRAPAADPNAVLSIEILSSLLQQHHGKPGSDDSVAKTAAERYGHPQETIQDALNAMNVYTARQGNKPFGEMEAQEEPLGQWESQRLDQDAATTLGAEQSTRAGNKSS